MIGGFLLFSFRKNLPYIAFASPQIGVLFSVGGAAVLYSFLGFSIFTSFILMSITGSIVTLLAIIYYKISFNKKLVSLFVFALIVIFFSFYITNYTTLHFSSPGFIYMDGTDHLGYAQLADWLASHGRSGLPQLSSALPYQSWPAYSYAGDPRFGSFIFLAIISKSLGLSGMFAYYPAVAILLMVASLGIAALFSSSRTTFIIIVIGCVTNIWYASVMRGLLGNVFAYPSFILLIGLLFSIKECRLIYVLFLCALAFIIAGIYPANAALAFLIPIGAIYLLSVRVYNKQLTFSEWKNHLCFWSLIALALVFSAGVVARPVPFGLASQVPAPWYKVIATYLSFGRDADGLPFVHWHFTLFVIAFVLTFLVSIVGLVIAHRRKNAVALSLLLTPLVLLVALLILNKKWILYQLSGIYYPLQIIGLSLLWDKKYDNKQLKVKASKWWLLLPVIMLVIHLPATFGAIKHYTKAHGYSQNRFSHQQMQHLTKLLNHHAVTVDLKNVVFALPLLVELGNNPNIHLHWTKDSWKAIVGYRSWPAPKAVHTPFVITLKKQKSLQGCHLVYQTQQYHLFKC